MPGDPVKTYSRMVLAMSWLLAIVFLTVWRIAFDVVMAGFRKRGIGLTRVLVVGGADFGRALYKLLSTNLELGYSSAGFVEDDHFDALDERVRRDPVDEVEMATRQVEADAVRSVVALFQSLTIRFSMVPTLFNVMTSCVQVREIAGVPIFALDERIFLRSSRLLKRAIDLTLGTIALLLKLPLFGAVAALIRLESKGPSMIKQTS